MLHLLFQLGRERYAIEATKVVEMLPFIEVSPIPHAPKGVAGVLNIRGHAVPLIDLRDLVLHLPSQIWLSTRIVLIRSNDRLFGLIVERATETLRCDPESFVPSPVQSPATPYLGAVATDERGLIQLLDVDKLLPAIGMDDSLFRQEISLMSLTEIENLLYKAMGLDAASIGKGNIERAVNGRIVELQLGGIEEYGHRLQTSPVEIQELVEAVVVPETWFFRHSEAFAELNRTIMNEWLPTHPWGLLRLVSIPCSTGEEPYSIVMSLLDAGLPAERFTVEAWDISQRALARAERGIYSRNSFRSANLDFRDRYFQPVKDGYQVLDSVKRQVTFRHTNMLASEHQARAPHYDVVFCRNVLIYFDRPTQEQALNNIKHLLLPDGFLFVGPAEALLMRAAGFIPSDAAMSFGFRRSTSPAKVAPHVITAPAVPPPLKPLTLQPAKTAVTSTIKSISVPPPLASSPAVPTSGGLEAVQKLADMGRMKDAAAECEAFLKTHSNSAPGYYLQGVIRDALGDSQGATQSYRKAIYLNPNHSEALVHLALLAEKSGNTAEAQRFHERARRAAKTGGDA